MKDLPHHLKKLNRRVIRSLHREEMEGSLVTPGQPLVQTERQKKKQAKQKIKKEKLAKPPRVKTIEEHKSLSGSR
ncbi:MAG: hypothetical protein HY069_00130 [Chlamydiia bacterium]|nr:hypothetical protein [Chlamydiia bacterium]